MPRRALCAAVLVLAGCQSLGIEEKNLVAVGTEPFWSVEVDPGELTYATPERLLGASAPAERKADGAGITWRAVLEGQPLVLRVEAGRCSDGMSDAVYPYRATLTVAGQQRRGCARNGPGHER